jgi:hypothetical protein
MAGQQEYTNRTSLFYDLNLWLAWKRSEDLSLGHLPKLAADRWSWIVDNWESSLRTQFKTQANGDDYLENNLATLEANVFGWRQGAKVNPMRDVAFFQDISEFFLQVQLTAIGLTTQETTFVNLELKRVSEFTIDTFRAMLRFLKSQRDLSSDLIGLGDDLYSEIMGKTTATKQRDTTTEDLVALQQTTEIENFVLGIILDFKYQKDQSPNLLQISQGNISPDSDVQLVDVYRSYFEVPFTTSLEQMASDYLGSKTLWYELATVNNLKPPYVDTAGVRTELLENGSGVTCRVSDEYVERLRIGATVGVSSRIVPIEYRVIERSTINGDGTVSLQLRGLDDLSKYKTIHGAYLRVFAPETIQEFSFVKIPFAIRAPFSKSPSPGTQALKTLDKALYNFGVDLSMNETTGDLVFSAQGDLKLQAGLANIRQAVANRIRTLKGQVPLHRDYGLPESIGDFMFGATTAAKIQGMIQNEIRKDARITTLQISDVVLGTNGATMRIDVGIQGMTQLVPFSFSV